MIVLGAALGLGVRYAAATEHSGGSEDRAGQHQDHSDGTSPDPAPSPSAESGDADPSPAESDEPGPSPAESDEPGPSSEESDEPSPSAPGSDDSDRGDDHSDHDGGLPVMEAEDYVDIADVPAAAVVPAAGPDASTGSVTIPCGRNENGHRNPDNFIVAPGTFNGAHHVHDYVGNLTTDGDSTDESLAAGGTTCAFGDRSTYFWPVLRDITRTGDDADEPGGGDDGNNGAILLAEQVSIRFLGNRQDKVVPAERFLRVITGDAKAFENGPDAPNANAKWTCSGTPDRVSTDQYPLCPSGQLVQRLLDFPGCWNGEDTDSADHRSHMAFADEDTGACPDGTEAIPQLRITLGYAPPPGRSFAVDSFPENKNQPETDHADWANVMSDRLMREVTECINAGVHC